MLVVPPIDQSSKRVRWQDMANVSVPSVANTSTFAPNGMFTNENVLGLGAYAQPHGRYNVPIGYALKDIAAGSWVHERLLRMPEARALTDLPQPVAASAPTWSRAPTRDSRRFARCHGARRRRERTA